MPSPALFRKPRAVDAACLAALALAPLLLFFPALFLGRWISGDDAQGLYWPLYAETARGLARGQWPLWVPDLYGGMPGVASCNLLFLYPTDLLANLLGWPFQRLLGVDAALHVALAGTGMFLFLRRWGRSSGAALLGGAFFALSGSEVSQLYGGFYNFVEGVAWIPWAFWAALGAREDGPGSWRRWGLCGAAWGLQILAGAAQLFTYTAVAVACFLPARNGEEAGAGSRALEKPRRFRAAAGLALALGVAALLAAPQILPTLGYLPLTARQGFTRAAFARGSIRLQDALAWIVPGFFGWQAPTYHGGLRYGLTSEYFGLLPWLLAAGAAWALARAESGVRRLLALAALAFFLAQSAWMPFYGIIQRLPVLAGFHLWSRTLFLLTFALCALAARGWDALAEPGERSAVLRGALGFAALAAAAALLAWVLAPLRAGSDAPHLPWLWSTPQQLGAAVDTLTGLARASAGRTLLLLPAAAALAWLAARRSRADEGRAAALVLALALGLHLLDQSSVLTRFIRFIAPSEAVPPSAFTNPPPAPPGLEPWRIYDADQAAPDKDMLLGYDNLYGGETVPPLGYVKTVQALRATPQTWARWLDLMDVRAVFVHSRSWPRLDHDQVRVVPNPGAFPRAWLAGRVLPVPDDAAARSLLVSPAFDPRAAVAVEGATALDTRPRGSVRWLDRSPLSLSLDVDTDQAAALVLADAWYPDWKARVDGNPVKVLRADGLLRALPLAPGRHRVDFFYDTRNFDLGLALAGLGLLSLAGLGLAGLRRRADARTGA